MSDQMYFKVLSPKGTSIHGGNLTWSLPTQKPDGTWKPGKWHKVDGDITVCRNGLHLTTEPFQWYTKDCICYAAEGKDASDSEGNKTAFAQARLLYPVPHPQWWLDALAFVASISDMPFMKPDGNPKPEWKLFTAPTLKEARAAAWAARAAVEDAAWDAARDTARAAKRDTAWDAVGAAVWAAVEDAVGAAALAAAWDAARDASLYTQVINICADLKLDEKHIQHVKARWEVWQKGYCLLRDVGGKLYVYSKEG